MYRVLVNHQSELFEPLLEVNYVVLLVCIGSLFLQRHGFFSIFVYVGYMLPSLIIGYPVSYHTYLNSDMVMFVIAFALIAYRVLLSVIAPIWMARAATLKWKNRAIVNTIILALIIQIVMQFYQVILKINNVILSEQLIYSTFVFCRLDGFWIRSGIWHVRKRGIYPTGNRISH